MINVREAEIGYAQELIRCFEYSIKDLPTYNVPLIQSTVSVCERQFVVITK